MLNKALVTRLFVETVKRQMHLAWSPTSSQQSAVPEQSHVM